MSGSASADSFDVVVVGGGFAGVTAARDLRDQGLSVLLLEARDRLGGRTWFRQFNDLDLKVEMGGTWFLPAQQHSIVGEIERYNLPIVQTAEPQTMRHRLAGDLTESALPVPPAEIPDLERLGHHLLTGADRIDIDKPIDEQDLADLDVSLTDYVAPLDLPTATLHYVYAHGGFLFGTEPDKTSVLNLLWWIAGADHSIWKLITMADKIGSGTGSLIDAMVADAQPTIRLNAPVREIHQDSQAARVTTAAGEVVTAAAVVVAVPLNVLGDIAFSPELASAKRAIADAGHAGESVKAWALVENAPRGLAAVGWGGGLDWMTADYELSEGSLFVGFGSGPHKLNINDPADIARAIQFFLPDTRVTKTAGYDWNADPYSKGTWTAYRPGQMTKYMAELQKPEGRLAFAGTDYGPKWFAWIDGAIDSGRAAAQQVLEMAI